MAQVLERIDLYMDFEVEWEYERIVRSWFFGMNSVRVRAHYA